MSIKKYTEFKNHNEEIDGGYDEFDGIPYFDVEDKPVKKVRSKPIRRKKTKPIDKEIENVIGDDEENDEEKLKKKKLVRSEEGNIKLRYTTKLKKIFKVLQTRKDSKKIADKFLNDIRKKDVDISFFNIIDTINNKLSCLPRNRIEGLERTKSEKTGKMVLKSYDNNQRQEIRLGGIINRIYPDEFTTREIELFVNEFKGEHDMATGNIEIRIVEGKDIPYWYASKRYSPGGGGGGGSLNQSCMRNEPETRFDAYTSNPKQIKMAIFVKGGKLEARAIVWTTDNGQFMDRVYYTIDHLNNAFHRYAEKNGMMYKGQTPNPPRLTVRLENKNFRNTPYFDTFRGNDGVYTAY